VEIWNDTPYLAATNFSQAEAQQPLQANCERYGKIVDTLAHESSNLSAGSAQELLWEVAQSNTQWSVVYDLERMDVYIRMGPSGSAVHRIHFDPDGLTSR
jgi:hypothetical protein